MILYTASTARCSLHEPAQVLVTAPDLALALLAAVAMYTAPRADFQAGILCAAGAALAIKESLCALVVVYRTMGYKAWHRTCSWCGLQLHGHKIQHADVLVYLHHNIMHASTLLTKCACIR